MIHNSPVRKIQAQLEEKLKEKLGKKSSSNAKRVVSAHISINWPGHKRWRWGRSELSVRMTDNLHHLFRHFSPCHTWRRKARRTAPESCNSCEVHTSWRHVYWSTYSTVPGHKAEETQDSSPHSHPEETNYYKLFMSTKIILVFY